MLDGGYPPLVSLIVCKEVCNPLREGLSLQILTLGSAQPEPTVSIPERDGEANAYRETINTQLR